MTGRYPMRHGLLMERYRTLPLLVVEDAGSGTQLIDTIRSRDAQIPLIAAKAVKAKIIRAEGVTPITTAGLVALPRDAPWRADFISEMANFPVGVHDDHVVGPHAPAGEVGRQRRGLGSQVVGRNDARDEPADAGLLRAHHHQVVLVGPARGDERNASGVSGQEHVAGDVTRAAADVVLEPVLLGPARA